MDEYLADLQNCELCEWRCGVDRLDKERGVCKIGKPKVASATLHPAPPESYTVFMSGCNYRCLNCQNWGIAHYPDTGEKIRGWVEPKVLAEEAVEKIHSLRGKTIGADRIFFSGGSPTPSLPYIEKVVEEARKLEDVKVNFDTNGFLTMRSLKRVLDFTTSITFDIKAYSDEVHRSLTGAPIEPVLRNARYVAENAEDQLWEFRTLLVPGINEEDVKPLAEFLADINKEVPLNFLAFRPHFVLEDYKGASTKSLKRAVRTAKEAGLKNVGWSGRPDIKGKGIERKTEEYSKEGAKIAGGRAEEVGCETHPRECGSCGSNQDCPVKNYRPAKGLFY